MIYTVGLTIGWIMRIKFIFNLAFDHWKEYKNDWSETLASNYEWSPSMQGEYELGQ